ncbi:MAG TPA: hypothetical protein VFH38_01770 [Jatrophihabitans sp.]|nr:hypothetical protein [Jatrophihabitans sp.]
MPVTFVRRAASAGTAALLAVLLSAAANSAATPDIKRKHRSARQHSSATTTSQRKAAPTQAPAQAQALLPRFGSPYAYRQAVGDTWYNTVDSNGRILATSNDTGGYAGACVTRAQHGSDIAINRMKGPPRDLAIRTINCMRAYGPMGGGPSPDGCSWKTGGITRIGHTVYLAVARQLRRCNADQSKGLQPSFNASIIKSDDDGQTWTNPWGRHSRYGAAPAWNPDLKRYRAMFAGQNFSAPFFVQYGPGNTNTVDGADKYLYAVSNDGYAYDGNYLLLGRVPLGKVQQRTAWQFYHRGANGPYWSGSLSDAAHVLDAKHGISQPAIQYVPALRRYVLVTFSYRYTTAFPAPSATPYTSFAIYSAPHPWGPWTRVFDRSTQRSLWCGTHCRAGSPNDHYGFYDPTLVQKYVFRSGPANQTVFTSGDFKNQTPRWEPVNLYRLRELPLTLVG